MEISLALWANRITADFNEILSDLSAAFSASEMTFRKFLINPKKGKGVEIIDKDFAECSALCDRFEALEDQYIKTFFTTLYSRDLIHIEDDPNCDIVNILQEYDKETPPEDRYMLGLKEGFGFPQCSPGVLVSLSQGKYNELSPIDKLRLQDYFVSSYFPLHIIIRDLSFIFANNYIAFALQKLDTSQNHVLVEGMCLTLHRLRPSSFIRLVYLVMIGIRTNYITRHIAPEAIPGVDRIDTPAQGIRYLTMKTLRKDKCSISISPLSEPTFDTDLITVNPPSVESRRILRASGRNNQTSFPWSESRFFETFIKKMEAATTDTKSTILNKAITKNGDKKTLEEVIPESIAEKYFKTLLHFHAKKLSETEAGDSYINLTKQLLSAISKYNDTKTKINMYQGLIEILIWHATDSKTKEEFNLFLDALAMYENDITKAETCLIFHPRKLNDNANSAILS